MGCRPGVVDWGGGVLAIAATAGPMSISAGSGWPHLHCSTTGSCQSTATSEIVNRTIPLSCKQRYIRTRPLPFFKPLSDLSLRMKGIRQPEIGVGVASVRCNSVKMSSGQMSRSQGQHGVPLVISFLFPPCSFFLRPFLPSPPRLRYTFHSLCDKTKTAVFDVTVASRVRQPFPHTLNFNCHNCHKCLVMRQSELCCGDAQRETKARQQLQIAARCKVRERRLQSARVRKYYDEYQVRQRSRMLKKRTKEELVRTQIYCVIHMHVTAYDVDTCPFLCVLHYVLYRNGSKHS